MVEEKITVWNVNKDRLAKANKDELIRYIKRLDLFASCLLLLLVFGFILVGYAIVDNAQSNYDQYELEERQLIEAVCLSNGLGGGFRAQYNPSETILKIECVGGSKFFQISG